MVIEPKHVGGWAKPETCRVLNNKREKQSHLVGLCI